MNTSAYVSVHSQKEKRLKCKLCKKTWVMHLKDWRYGLRADTEKVERTRALVGAGMSVRKIAQTVSVSPSTVQRWKFLIWGKTAFSPTDARLHLRQAQVQYSRPLSLTRSGSGPTRPRDTHAAPA